MSIFKILLIIVGSLILIASSFLVGYNFNEESSYLPDLVDRETIKSLTISLVGKVQLVSDDQIVIQEGEDEIEVSLADEMSVSQAVETEEGDMSEEELSLSDVSSGDRVQILSRVLSDSSFEAFQILILSE